MFFCKVLALTFKNLLWYSPHIRMVLFAKRSRSGTLGSRLLSDGPESSRWDTAGNPRAGTFLKSSRRRTLELCIHLMNRNWVWGTWTQNRWGKLCNRTDWQAGTTRRIPRDKRDTPPVPLNPGTIPIVRRSDDTLSIRSRRGTYLTCNRQPR